MPVPTTPGTAAPTPTKPGAAARAPPTLGTAVPAPTTLEKPEVAATMPAPAEAHRGAGEGPATTGAATTAAITAGDAASPATPPASTTESFKVNFFASKANFFSSSLATSPLSALARPWFSARRPAPLRALARPWFPAFRLSPLAPPWHPPFRLSPLAPPWLSQSGNQTRVSEVKKNKVRRSNAGASGARQEPGAVPTPGPSPPSGASGSPSPQNKVAAKWARKVGNRRQAKLARQRQPDPWDDLPLAAPS